MNIGTKGRYAIIGLVDMMNQDHLLQSGQAVTLADICARQNLSLVYLEQLFLKLKKANIVKSVRGRKGGYLFADRLKDISLKKILDAVEEKIETLRCVKSENNTCDHLSRYCQTHDLWSALEHTLFSYFDTLTLEDIKMNSFKINFPPARPSSHNSSVYLDYNATCPIKPMVQQAMLNIFENGGNASSVHSYGRQTRKTIEQARDKVASFFDVTSAQVIFTSGGTESNALALNSALKKLNIRRLYISALEHDSIRASAQHLAFEVGADLAFIPATPDGIISLENVQNVLHQEQQPFLVCLMAANNETGVIQPVQQIAQYVHKKGGIIHCDAVQALGKIPLNFNDLNVDTLSCSAHKIGGPQGSGVLIKAQNFPIYQLWQGGGQERGDRSGTENAASIVGFAEALAQSREDLDLWYAWKQALEAELQHKVPEVKIFGQKAPRLANTSCFTMPGVNNQHQVMAFDLAGYAVSAGSACSSGKVKISHVLQAMNIDESEAKTALRISWGWKTSKDELDHFVKTWYTIYQNNQKRPTSISL